MNKRLYVGGLSYSVDDDGLRELFTPFLKLFGTSIVAVAKALVLLKCLHLKKRKKLLKL